jgi:hypothetical protein
MPSMSSSLEVIAGRLGLSYGTKHGFLHVPFVHGEMEGQKVRAVWSDRQTRVEALLDPGLDLGLRVHTRGFVEMPSLHGVLLGDSNWDGEVSAVADEPARARVLFAGPARAAVLGLNARHTGIAITDDAVGVFVNEWDADVLETAFQLVARTAALVSEARRSVPPAEPLSHHARALRAFAAEHPCHVDETPLHAHGDLGPSRFVAHFVRTGRGAFDLDVRVAPVEPGQGIGLLVRCESAVDRVRTFLGGQDLQTGDAAFDPAFLVRAAEPDRAIAALDPDVRALLLDLRARFEKVTLDDASLSLRGPAARVRPDELGMLLDLASTVVDHVARAGAAVLRGPYR